MPNADWKPYAFAVKLELQAPVLTQASGALALGLDSACHRDVDGVPVLPGTLVKGNVTHALRDLLEICDDCGLTLANVETWFGKASAPGQDDAPERGRVVFGRYWRATSGHRNGVRNRIAVDRKTGAVKTGALQIIESPFVSGQKVRFEGKVSGWFEGETEAKRFGDWLQRGLLMTPAMGALKGAGFGRVLSAKVAAPEVQSGVFQDSGVLRGRYGLRISPTSPFCFARHRPGNNETYNAPQHNPALDDPEVAKEGVANVYISEDFIPGGAIKGAIATLLREIQGKGAGEPLDPDPATSPFPEICKCLDDLVLTHAFAVDKPTNSGQRRPTDPDNSKRLERGGVIPLSLAAYEEGGEIRFFDLARRLDSATPAGLFRLPKGKSEDPRWTAPAFPTDWKSAHWKAAGKYAGGLPMPRRMLDIRTAIDSETGAAKEHQLFVMESVSPAPSEDAADGCDWLGEVVFPENADRKALVSELRTLLAHGLHRLGKTKCSANAELMTQKVRKPPEKWVRKGAHGSGEVVITLQSMARLLRLRELSCPPTNGGLALFEDYAKAWKDLSGDALILRNFFADHQLIGGAYWWRRYRKQQKPYNPELYTKAGSVFVFEVAREKIAEAESLLQDWALRGLPQRDDAWADWRTNPYVRENGYGEIAVNSDVHWKEMEGEAQWVALEPVAGDKA